MSKQLTRREIMEQMEAAQARVAEQETELETLTEQAASDLSDRDAKIDGLTQRVAELESHVETVTQERDDAQAEVQRVTDEWTKATEERDQAITDRDNARAALKNPAFADAALNEAQTGEGGETVAAQIDAEADEAEAEAKAEAEAERADHEPSFDKWMEITDPKEKRAYWMENRDAILATQPERSK